MSLSRTIQLTCIHALNWYGYKDSIPVEGNLLLAGVTGSGKSILMDLIQFVLVGDQRLVRFNQSATGDRSDRSLKGYCLGDTKEEENGVTQYMRSSAISYVALEFRWPGGKRFETWGIRVEFANAAELQGRVTPFFIPSSLNRGDFLDPEKRPLDYTAFKALAEGNQGRLYPEGITPYLRDMAQPTHLNFDKDVLRSLLPTAMSFTFLKSFNEFARNFILPGDKLDVGDVTASYRTFLGYERDLNELNDQFEKLKTIQNTFIRMMEFRRDRDIARFLESESRHLHALEILTHDRLRFAKLKTENAAEESRLKELDETIVKGRAELRDIDSLIGESSEGKLYKFIKGRNTQLVSDIARLSGIGATVDDALKNRARRARTWLKDLRVLPLDMDFAAMDAVEQSIRRLEAGGGSNAGETLKALSLAAQQAAEQMSRAAAPANRKLADLRQHLGQWNDEVSALKIGRLPFPTRLLDTLNDALPSAGAELPARHLRALCEVMDERWRPAIEVAFARKFAIVVAAEHYDQAEKIYHGLKASELGHDGGRESLVNPWKALLLGGKIRAGSLAEKLSATHPVAKAMIAHFFGDLICVASLAALRALPAGQNGILPDGFASRGAIVERRRFYDGNPFVGEKGLEQQLAWKQKQIGEFEAEIAKLLPVERLVKAASEVWRELFETPPDLYRDLAEAQALPKFQAELESNIKQLNAIDRAKFDELARRQSDLESHLKNWETEQRALYQSEKRTELRQLERRLETLQRESETLTDRWNRVRNETDVSMWSQRLDEVRSATLAQFPAKDAAADAFKENFHAFDKHAAATLEELKASRRALAAAYSRFDDLPVESESNEAHDKQLARLNESDIPDYAAKAQRERKSWENLFRTQILDKLHGALEEVLNLISLLNNSLKKKPIGSNTYELRYRRNPDYQLYHELLEASSLARPDDLFFASAEPRFRDAIGHFLKTLTDQSDSAEAARLLDYRFYYEYDMEVVESDGRKTSVDRHSGKFSGGENQSPYFIAILASYLRAYRRYTARKTEPSLGLVPIDEAFSKLSNERIKDCIMALKAFDLQGVLSMSTGNIPSAFEHCDWLVVVSKDERRTGKRMEIRNVPVSLARDSDEARGLMNE